MPELPDVENYRRYLERHALRKTVAGVEVANRKVLDDVAPDRLSKAVRGRSMERTRRIGKYLAVRLDDDTTLTFHFGMTARFTWFGEGKDQPRHARVRFDFDDGHLAFVDQRMIGRIALGEPEQRHDLGPDALDLDADGLRERLSGKRGAIKAALMDQATVAGIGNVYADEILFQAGVHPATPVAALDEGELGSLHRTMRHVLKIAIDRGAGYDDALAERLPDSWLLPRREKGAPCPRCGGQVDEHRTGGRRGYYCPSCQRPPCQPKRGGSEP